MSVAALLPACSGGAAGSSEPVDAARDPLAIRPGALRPIRKPGKIRPKLPSDGSIATWGRHAADATASCSGAAGGHAGEGSGGVGGASGYTGGGGGATGAVCGNDVREGDETCDGADLGGAVCGPTVGVPLSPESVPFPAPNPVCTAACTLDAAACDPPVRLIGYGLSTSSGWAISTTLAWDAAAKAYVESHDTLSVDVPAGTPLPAGATYVSFTSSPFALAPGQTLPDYAGLRTDDPAFGYPFYSPSWDYDVFDAFPPYAPLPARRTPLLLRRVAGTSQYVVGSGQPWVPGRGALRLVLAVAYVDQPMPDADRAKLLDPAGIATSTSLAAVPGWIAARAADAQVGSPPSITFVDSGASVKIPADQVPTDYGSCFAADFSSILAPQANLQPGDVLVQLLWAPDGTQCSSHVLWSERSYVLFATPSYFDLATLTVSGAHELMHLFGASDKYTDTVIQDENGVYRGCWFADGADFSANDIMCHRIATTNPDGSFAGFVSPPLAQLTVAPLTAREVGWVDLDGDGALEIDDACPWDPSCH